MINGAQLTAAVAALHPIAWWLIALVGLATAAFAGLRLLVPDNDAALFAFLPVLVAVLLVRLVTWPVAAYLALPLVALAEIALLGYCFFGRRSD